MICGNASDFIDRPQPKDYVGPPTTPGPQAPHHQNPALIGIISYEISMKFVIICAHTILL